MKDIKSVTLQLNELNRIFAALIFQTNLTT